MSQPDGVQLQRVESYQWPAAHVGHLNESQRNALDSFKGLCEEKGYYSPRSADGATPASHDEETLLRYLRARKFLPQEAFGQFKDTEDWRNENDLDGVYETIDVDEYEQTRKLYPQWTGRRDKRGIPFYVYQISDVDAKAVSAHNSDKTARKGSITNTKTPRNMLRLMALYENLCRFVLPLCSAIPDRPISETPISQSSNLVDLSKVGLTKFWSLRTHMSAASQLATAHYPETLDRIFVVGAPSFFPTVWEAAKKWFDPITVSKIFILSEKNMAETLQKFINIENIPIKYGGKLDWKFGDMPFIEPQIVNAMQWREQTAERGHRTWPKGPIKWQYDENGDLVAMAIGTENGVQRRRVLAQLHPEVGIAQLALSPGRASPDQVRPNIATRTGAKSASGERSSVDSTTTSGSHVAMNSLVPTIVGASTLGTNSSEAASSYTPQINHAQDYEAPVQDNYALLAQRSRDDVPPEQPAPPAMQQSVLPPVQREEQLPVQQGSEEQVTMSTWRGSGSGSGPGIGSEDHFANNTNTDASTTMSNSTDYHEPTAGKVMPQTMSMWRGDGPSLGSDGHLTNNANTDAFTSSSSTNNHTTVPISEEFVGSSTNNHTTAPVSEDFAGSSINSHTNAPRSEEFVGSSTNNHTTAPLSEEFVGPSPPPASESSRPVVGSTPSIPREGTSATRYEQQAGTHAEGQSAGPVTKLDGAGEGHSVIDPSTVGQAPKEHSLPKSTEEAPAPGLMETAQQYASVAYHQAAQLPSTVLAAVGLGGGSHATREGAHKEVEPEAEKKREYPEIDQLDGSAIEEYLRSQVVSTKKK